MEREQILEQSVLPTELCNEQSNEHNVNVVDGEVRTSTRERKPTDKYRQYELQRIETNFNSAISAWRRKANKLQKLLSDSVDILLLRKERDALEETMNNLSVTHEQLRELCDREGISRSELLQKYDSIEDTNVDLVKDISETIRSLQFDTRSCKSSSSKKSAISTSSKRAEAAAKTEALKTKLKFSEIEKEKRIQLEKQKAELVQLETMKDLALAEAEQKALEQIEGDDRGSVEFHNDESPINTYQLNPAARIFTPNRQEDTAAWVQTTVAPPKEYLLRENTTFTENLAKTMSQQMALSRLPTPEPSVFYGDPLTYQSWKASFQTLIEHRGIPPAERIHYLKRYLGGEARETIEGYFLIGGDTAYEEAKTLLEKRYGDHFVISNAFRNKLETWPKIPPRDGTALRKFSDFLRQCCAAQMTISNPNVLNDEHENRKLLLKLPDWTITRWARIAADMKRNQGRYPTFKEFVTFIAEEADIACDPITSLQSLKVNKQSESPRQPPKRNLQSKTFSTQTQEAPAPLKARVTCEMCEKDHHIDICKEFLSKSLEERKQIAVSKKLCFGCLSPGHRSKFCKQRKTCGICSKRHPTSLHGDQPKRTVSTSDDSKPKTTSVSHLSNTGNGSKCSMIVPVWISHKNNPGVEKLTYALLDTQSDTTFILDDTCSSLDIDGPPVSLLLSTMLAENEVVESRRIDGLLVRSHDSSTRISLPPVYTRSIMPANLSHVPTPEKARQWPHLKHIAKHLLPIQDVEVGLLIGYNCPRALAPRDVIPPVDNEPYGQRTDLGWGIVGLVDPSSSTDVHDPIGVSHRVLANEQSPTVIGNETHFSKGMIAYRTSVKEIIDPATAARILEQDFNERQTVTESLSYEDHLFLRTIRNGIQQDQEGHYVMPLPFREPKVTLPNNRSTADHRLRTLRNRFLKDPAYYKDYVEFMENIIQSGYAERPNEKTSDVWYIPHHGIYHPKKPNKIRIVFDCSAKFNGLCLNDILLQGPDMTNTLAGVLCRFRQEPVAFMCDIEQMFFQFKVTEEHRDYLRFLWWPNGDYNKRPTEYRMTVHLFGAVSSPGCANFGLKHTANEYERDFGKDAADFIRNDFYVDDGLKSVESAEDAISLIDRSKGLCASGGLRLHKFVSNSKQVINMIPRDDQAKELKSLDLNLDQLPIERALGVHWCIESDSFKFQITLKDRPFTRRGVLSTICSIFDPLGFLSPVLLHGKQLLQQMCRDNTEWDAPLPYNLKNSWEQWRNNLLLLGDLSISRCFKPEGFGKIKHVELHHFSDASSTGYGQCSYIRQVNEHNKVHCAFLMGKSRVTPKKVITIPRLELTAATVSVKVSELLQRELSMNSIRQTFWTDSKVALGYIQNDARKFHVFVANRVQQIRDVTTPDQWRYVTTEVNPADLASRGTDAGTFIQTTDWLQGPNFLWQQTIQSFDRDLDFSVASDDPEVRKAQVRSTQTRLKPQEFELDRLEYFSDWHKAKRAIASCLKVKKYLLERLRNKTNLEMSKQISVQDLESAEQEIIRHVQRQSFRNEIRILQDMSSQTDGRKVPKGSPIYRLDPFLDASGILRVGGRLQKTDLPYDLRSPIILPRKHHVTTLIIRYFHSKTAHQGRGITINAIRGGGFWIIGCCSSVTQIIRKCITCRRLYTAAQVQKMSILPEDRANPAPPFTYCGVDFFGPFLIKEKRKEVKRYGVIFTCMASRAVHLETANSLDTSSFINTLRRFISIRGPIRQLRSDCGTNFVGAERELREALQEMDQSTVQDFLLKRSCDFIKFERNAPSASHTGGVWERQIRTVRRVLSGLLRQEGNQLDDESLRTLLCEAAATINSRPLTYDNLNDPTSMALTPNNLLTMKSDLILPPPGQFQKADLYSRKRWRRVQHLANFFWDRWKKEYLQSLQIRSKWNRPQRNLQVGDLVLVIDDNLPRNQWQLCRVQETVKTTDGHVRRVKLAVGTSNLNDKGERQNNITFLERPIQKLVLILENEAF